MIGIKMKIFFPPVLFKNIKTIDLDQSKKFLRLFYYLSILHQRRENILEICLITINLYKF